MKEKIIKEKVTQFWGLTFRAEYNSAFWVGVWGLLVIITFPVWIWFGIIYLIIVRIGKKMCRRYGKKEILEHEREENEYY